ncbi:MAG: hypothetical protein ACRD6W_04850 [Nitrososphaerales archaeon]
MPSSIRDRSGRTGCRPVEPVQAKIPAPGSPRLTPPVAGTWRTASASIVCPPAAPFVPFTKDVLVTKTLPQHPQLGRSGSTPRSGTIATVS